MTHALKSVSSSYIRELPIRNPRKKDHPVRVTKNLLLRGFDPLGPGGPAWEAADAALAAYRKVPPGQHNQWNKDYKRYCNFRAYMVIALKRHGAPQEEISQWLDFLEANLGADPSEI